MEKEEISTTEIELIKQIANNYKQAYCTHRQAVHNTEEKFASIITAERQAKEQLVMFAEEHADILFKHSKRICIASDVCVKMHVGNRVFDVSLVQPDELAYLYTRYPAAFQVIYTKFIPKEDIKAQQIINRIYTRKKSFISVEYVPNRRPKIAEK